MGVSTYQLVQDFFHQQYGVDSKIQLAVLKVFTDPCGFFDSEGENFSNMFGFAAPPGVPSLNFIERDQAGGWWTV